MNLEEVQLLVDKVRKHHRRYVNVITREAIPWYELDFGTADNSKCGICGSPEKGKWSSKGELVKDIICDDCSLDWKLKCDPFDLSDYSSSEDEEYDD